MPYTPPPAGKPIRSLLLASMVGAWQSYTPTWTASGSAPSVGSGGSLIGRYVQIGGAVHFAIKLTGGSGTTWGSGTYSFALPVPVASGIDMIGDAFIGDASAGSAAYSTGIAFVGAGASTVTAYIGGKNASSALSNANPQTFASGDRIWLTGAYEAA
ncbi:hypothetical protein [Streptomyces sp. E5N91]|uniref:hypothetical protein n=1 Tax=Streptomyces sp. E5N91 TaxID=1851996 RepID=UPI000EF56FC8|nr:hypothetical protein [Streptomyces sp. E5N91]